MQSSESFNFLASNVKPYSPDYNYVLTDVDEKCFSCQLPDCVGTKKKTCPIYGLVLTRGQKQHAKRKAKARLRT